MFPFLVGRREEAPWLWDVDALSLHAQLRPATLFLLSVILFFLSFLYESFNISVLLPVTFSVQYGRTFFVAADMDCTRVVWLRCR